MRRLIIVAVVVIGLGAAAFAAIEFGGILGRTEVTASADMSEVEVVAAPIERIVVDARVVPALEADLSLPVSGVLADLLVSEGDEVEAGQVLLRLENSRQAAAVAQAEAQLRRAQAALAELKSGARAQEIDQAEAALAAAQARVDRINNGPLGEEIAVARAAVAEAQASLQKVLEGASQQEIIAAEAELANAEAARRQAQAAYDEVSWRNDIGALPQAANLEQATNNVAAAQARLRDLQSGGSASDVAAARARVQRAQAELDSLLATNPADLAAAEAEVRQFQAQLDLLKAGARSETIAVAEADVAGAEASLAEAQAALSETELRAPFAGTVAALERSVGEQVAAGTSVIQLADLTTWQIETEDLTEFDVIGVKPGEPVKIAFDAIADLDLDGVVQRVRPIGEDKRGDIVYTLIIEPSEQDERLLWNLTAVVTIEAES